MSKRRWSRPPLVHLALMAFVYTFADAFASEPETANSEGGADAEAGEGRHVTRVIDGDTIALDGGERARSVGVDTPETVPPQKRLRFSKLEEFRAADHGAMMAIGSVRARCSWVAPKRSLAFPQNWEAMRSAVEATTASA
jgi:endonuclease YncB( thermonuclease family)